jgi:hypothetical protein
MNHALTLSLELLEQAAWGFRFKLTAQNRSCAKLFFPGPRIVGIRFCNAAKMKEAEWYTSLLVSGDCKNLRCNPESCVPSSGEFGRAMLSDRNRLPISIIFDGPSRFPEVTIPSVMNGESAMIISIQNHI